MSYIQLPKKIGKMLFFGILLTLAGCSAHPVRGIDYSADETDARIQLAGESIACAGKSQKNSVATVVASYFVVIVGVGIGGSALLPASVISLGLQIASLGYISQAGEYLIQSGAVMSGESDIGGCPE